jgi:hypothetical protein
LKLTKKIKIMSFKKNDYYTLLQQKLPALQPACRSFGAGRFNSGLNRTPGMPVLRLVAEFLRAGASFKPYMLCAALLYLSSVCQSFSVCFVVYWLGGSFAKLGFSVGLCGFANVPPNALLLKN